MVLVYFLFLFTKQSKHRRIWDNIGIDTGNDRRTINAKNSWKLFFTNTFRIFCWKLHTYFELGHIEVFRIRFLSIVSSFQIEYFSWRYCFLTFRQHYRLHQGSKNVLTLMCGHAYIFFVHGISSLIILQTARVAHQ